MAAGDSVTASDNPRTDSDAVLNANDNPNTPIALMETVEATAIPPAAININYNITGTDAHNAVAIEDADANRFQPRLL